MEIGITYSELELLLEMLKKSGGQIESAIKNSISTRLYLSEDQAVDLSELCSEYLLEFGFDENYKTNDKGNVLEGLIDKLFLE